MIVFQDAPLLRDVLVANVPDTSMLTGRLAALDRAPACPGVCSCGRGDC